MIACLLIPGKWTYFIAVIFLFGIFGTFFLPEMWSIERSAYDKKRINAITNDVDARIEHSLPKSLLVKKGIWKPLQVLLKQGN